LVGVLNADSLLNFPDFRAFERGYQLITQVAGRSGRAAEQGQVAIQSFNPNHQILKQVAENNYQEMFDEQLAERLDFLYPPYCRMVKITLQFKNAYVLDNAANWLGKAMKNTFGNFVLGPSIPFVSRVRNNYIRNITLKIPATQSMKEAKKSLQKIVGTFQTIKDYRVVKITLDVDPY
jgi:primosomal protein N' (replication factor Y)